MPLQSDSPVLKKPVHLSTAVLLTIATFDLITTLMWLNIGGMEGNPFFSWVANSFGAVGLVVAKMVYLVVPVSLLEFVRTKKPRSGEIGTWIAAGLYALLYCGHLLQMREQFKPQHPVDGRQEEAARQIGQDRFSAQFAAIAVAPERSAQSSLACHTLRAGVRMG